MLNLRFITPHDECFCQSLEEKIFCFYFKMQDLLRRKSRPIRTEQNKWINVLGNCLICNIVQLFFFFFIVKSKEQSVVLLGAKNHYYLQFLNDIFEPFED